MKKQSNQITVELAVNASMDKVWQLWTSPEHIAKWNDMDENWHSPKVENDLKDEGRFLYQMETRDGSQGFDHCGTYDKVIFGELIKYTLTDGRKVSNNFRQESEQVIITETFDPEKETPVKEQRQFCQSVLNNFKKYVETIGK